MGCLNNNEWENACKYLTLWDEERGAFGGLAMQDDAQLLLGSLNGFMGNAPIPCSGLKETKM